MNRIVAVCLLACAVICAGQVRAGALDSVRRAGVVQCGGAPQPGLAVPGADGTWHGLEVDVCRAIAAAVLGDAERIVFRPYLRDADYARDPDQVAFVTVGDLVAHGLLGTLLPGPTVYYATIGLMVEDDSPVRDAADLGAGGVCFEPGTITDRALDSYFAAHHLTLHPMPFQETEEMVDAADGGRCAAVAGDVRLAGDHRILPDVIAAIPLMAASPIDDGRWAAVIAWTMATLLRAEANAAPPPADGPMPLLPIDAPSLGLTEGWQARVIAAVGDYGAIYRRTIGEPRGPNGLRVGGLTVPAAE